MNSARILPAAILLIFLLFRVKGAQSDQYEGIPFPPYEFFEAVLTYSQERDFPALETSLRYLKPLLDALKDQGRDIGEELRSAVAEKDALVTRRALRKLILMDMRHNLAEASRADDERRRRERLQMAYVDFYFLSTSGDRGDGFDDNGKARSLFKQANRPGKVRAASQALSELQDLNAAWLKGLNANETP